MTEYMYAYEYIHVCTAETNDVNQLYFNLKKIKIEVKLIFYF